MSDEECIHGLLEGTCVLCANVAPTSTGDTRSGGAPESLDTPDAVEKYRHRYSGEREATFEAYVHVFFSFPGARDFPGGWTSFSRCANAEPALARDQPELVARAERLMQLAGYVADDSGRPGKGRRWRLEAR